MEPTFIFMLTRADRTVPNARELLDEALAAGVRHIGFKDVGLPIGELKLLAREIRAASARAYLEMVSLSEASEVASARIAVELGIDVLLGGTRPSAVLRVIRGTAIEYSPFAGDVTGHPSRLKGSVADIIAKARLMAHMDGVHGLDLLAYRFDGDASRLIAGVCTAVRRPIIVAGSIDRPERIETVVRSGARAFTIGTAALDGAFAPSSRRLAAQLEAITSIASSAAKAADGR